MRVRQSVRDFLDILREQVEHPNATRQSELYQSRLRALASHPRAERRPIAEQAKRGTLHSLRLHQVPEAKNFQKYDIGCFDLQDGTAQAEWFYLAKQEIKSSSFIRWDVLRSEVDVLESLAMGVDAYSLDVDAHDAAALQYLCELGADYGVPALLHCYNEHHLAQALFLETATILYLAGELAQPRLLDLPLFRGQTVLIQARADFGESAAVFTTQNYARLILHLET